jgi:hypothetical protein
MGKVDPILLTLVGFTSLFVFITGMIGVNYYSENKDVKMRVSKINFSSFVGYALGLTPVLFFITNTIIQYLPSMFFSRALFAVFALISLFSWILCAVLLSDMRNDKKVPKDKKVYLSVILSITLLFFLAFGFAAYRGDILGKSFGGMTMSGKGGNVNAEAIGEVLNNPAVQGVLNNKGVQSLLSNPNIQNMVASQMSKMPQFGKRMKKRRS